MKSEPNFLPELEFFGRLANYGYSPAVVYDVGAANGRWSSSVSNVFTRAKFHLFEPLAGACAEYKGEMEKTLAANPQFTLHQIAVGNRNAEVKFYVSPDGYSSSLFRITLPGWTEVVVPCCRIDDYAASAQLPPPNVIKIDVQAAEVLVLEGCGALLENVDLLLLECWLSRGYGPSTPLLTEVIAALAPRNFVLVDMRNAYFDPACHQLTGVDAFFLSKRLLDIIKVPSGNWAVLNTA